MHPYNRPLLFVILLFRVFSIMNSAKSVKPAFLLCFKANVNERKCKSDNFSRNKQAYSFNGWADGFSDAPKNGQQTFKPLKM